MEPLRIVLDRNELYAYRCPICPGERNLVPGQGPAPCRWFALGEAPGQNENARKMPFCGMTGYELDNTYLKIAGLDRREVFVSNVCHCQPTNNRKPKANEAHWCSRHFLPSELALAQPDYLIAMGATACSLFSHEIDLEAMHGIPQWRELYGWEGWVFPTYHPAAGLHSTEMMVPLLEDFESLRKIVVDGVDPQSLVPVDRWPKPVYREIGGEILSRLLEDTTAPPELAIDQENEDGEMRSIQVSRMAGTGFLIRTADEYAMSVFREHCARDRRFTYLLHNAPGDLDWLAKYNITLPDGMDRLVDTMQCSYQLGNLPQGLKPLAYRLCGMQMHSYTDTVDPPSRAAVVAWLREAEEYALPKISDGLTRGNKPKHKYIIVKNALMTGIKRILEHTEEEKEPGEKKYDPWKAWQTEKEKWAAKVDEDSGEKTEVAVESLMRIEEELGPMPTRGLARVSAENELRYACADSDATIRVAAAMQGRASRVGREVAGEDYAK